MSSFQNAVIRQEEYLRQAADGSIPAGMIRRRYAGRHLMLVSLGIFTAGVLSIFWHELSERWPLSSFSTWGVQAIIGLCLVWWMGFVRSSLISSAILELSEVAQIRATREAEAARRVATVEAEQSRQQQAMQAETNAQRRALFEFRFKALKFMEDGILALLQDARRREEWVPETLDEERIFQVIRSRIQASAAPEFGILRRSFNPRVVMVLGDQSCLPPEPTDELLARRQLPAVAQLLN